MVSNGSLTDGETVTTIMNNVNQAPVLTTRIKSVNEGSTHFLQ